MRVATRTLYQGMNERISGLTAELTEVNKKISSGKKINRPSDDPIGIMESMQLKTALAQFDQYGRNIEHAQAWDKQSESVLSQAVDLVTRAKEIGVQMASDTQNAATRSSAAVEIGQLIDQAISLANTKLNGRYIFAGYKTSTVPFTKVTAGGIETAQYNGDSNDFQMQIGKEENIFVGRNGQTVFMDSNLFDTLGNLKKALEDNSTDDIAQQLDSLSSVADDLNNQISDIGARENRLEGKQNLFNQVKLDFEERLSEVQDSDLAEMMIELQAKQVAYQAALTSAAKLQALTLMNYMS
jgi:flagellar hook-associated protein 3 FlgL